MIDISLRYTDPVMSVNTRAYDNTIFQVVALARPLQSNAFKLLFGQYKNPMPSFDELRPYKRQMRILFDKFGVAVAHFHY